MRRLSSNLTIILKVFLPILYITFFGSLLIGSLVVSINDAPLIASNVFRGGFAIVFSLFVILMYFTIIQLKRVDGDKEYLYINNYLKTYRYKWEDILKIKTRNYGLFRTMHIHFKTKSSIGKRVTFMPSDPLIKDFFKDHPELFPLLEE